ncbi:MAG: hypothetical protein QXO76_09925, partial [Thermoproteota archaeon]
KPPSTRLEPNFRGVSPTKLSCSRISTIEDWRCLFKRLTCHYSARYLLASLFASIGQRIMLEKTLGQARH